MSKRRASAAAVRARIYRDFLRGMSIFAIAEGLARDGIPSYLSCAARWWYRVG